MRLHHARYLILLCALTGARDLRAQAAPPPRWTIEADLTGEPARGIDWTTYVALKARLVTTGVLEWNVVGAVHGVGMVKRGDVVDLLDYCPGNPFNECPPYNDRSQLAAVLMLGPSVRLVHLPRMLNRLIVEVGTGTYYARWTNRPYQDLQRPPVFTGYRTANLGLRVTKHVGVLMGATQFRNVRHRDDETMPRLGVEVRWP